MGHLSVLVESEDVLLGAAEEVEAENNSLDLEEELIGTCLCLDVFKNFWAGAQLKFSSNKGFHFLVDIEIIFS